MCLPVLLFTFFTNTCSFLLPDFSDSPSRPPSQSAPSPLPLPFRLALTSPWIPSQPVPPLYSCDPSFLLQTHLLQFVYSTAPGDFF